MPRTGMTVALTLLAGALHNAAAHDTIEATADLALDPARVYGPIVVKASGITIDGRGAWLVGADHRDAPKYRGVAISAHGISNVTLKNFNARGWETGLHITDGSGWTIEGCNFSDNFHDPDFGWGENGRRGGIVLERVRRSTLTKNKANRVWDACILLDSDDNRVLENDFSHTSNTCLKLWNASRNTVRGNNLSFGLRSKPGEVHARDSTSVLIESGSNDNVFEENDCTHGGDGIFIRVLNGWVSTGNRFERNDCSYANNNGFEAWSPRNTYRGNKANHCSYGFWLGASDQTVVVDNEASHNGDPAGFHNSPHLPGNGHAGIVFMFGPSSHTIVRGNTCIDNHGAGIALVGDIESQGKTWKAFHWIVEDNVLAGNRWGIFARFADWIDLAGNSFRDNRERDVFTESVTRLTVHNADPSVRKRPKAILDGPATASVDEAVAFDASKSQGSEGQPLSFRWDLGDGTTATTPRVEHIYSNAGFYRLGLTVTSGGRSDLAWRDLYVVARHAEIGTEGNASRWGWNDPDSKVVFRDDSRVRIAGHRSVSAAVRPYGGGRVTLTYPAAKDADWPLEGQSRLVFWLRVRNENIPAWQGPNPVVTLHGPDGKSLRLMPKTDWLAQPPYTEAREGWTYFRVPLAGDAAWLREGDALARATAVSLGFDSWGTPPLAIWIDGLAFE
jgi:parallel beta-helix repeat protein